MGNLLHLVLKVDGKVFNAKVDGLQRLGNCMNQRNDAIFQQLQETLILVKVQFLKISFEIEDVYNYTIV